MVRGERESGREELPVPLDSLKEGLFGKDARKRNKEAEDECVLHKTR